MIWSNPLCKKVEYIVIKGLNPSFAIAAIDVTACCSAIATSQNLSGNSSISLSIPVPLGIAAVTPTTFFFSLAKFNNASEKTEVADFGPSFFLNLPVSISKGPTPCQCSW